MDPIYFDGKALKDFNYSRSLEWLEANGVGGYASSTVSGANSRRYHGLLVASLNPPVERKVLLSKLEETIINGDDRTALSANQFPGVIHPQGFNHITSFERGIFPTFTYQVSGVTIRKTIATVHGENTTLVLYEVVDAQSPFTLELIPLASSKDFHSNSHANDAIYRGYVFQNNIFRTKNYEDGAELFIAVPGSNFTPTHHWYHNFEYAVEQYRGLDFQEDLFNHGVFSVVLKKGSKCGIIISTKNPQGRDAFKLLEQERQRRDTLIESYQQDIIKRLVLAADQFIVKRGEHHKTVIAGYHWFSDWGRDTMIALPGLCLATQRYDDAKKILEAFANAVSQGMLPNRFPDFGEKPEYNTVDATLWFFVAVYKYYNATNDHLFLKSLLPVLDEIIEWHYRGTRYNIHVDADELLVAGEEGVQLTWMDAKVGDWVVTPRKGKAVEINALWYNALMIMSALHGEDAAKTGYREAAGKVRKSFNDLFWCEHRKYFYDYVDGDHFNDDLRPNQIYAISLPFDLVSKERAHMVYAAITDNLLTPKGLRSLAPGNKEYKPHYGGSPWHRDGAYHQGTVWSFLFGPYIDVLMKLGGDKAHAKAKDLLEKFMNHLDEGCVGSVSEIFDAEPPHAPRGCIAQAWGVSEALRVIHEYQIFSPAKKNVRKISAVNA
jgi:predicted glycogen debranching enzyme